MLNYLTRRGIAATQILLACFLLACSVGISFGQSIYKAVDEEGKVTYSTEPPDDQAETHTLDLLAEPSETDIAEAQQRNEKIQKKLDKKQEDRNRVAERNAQAPATGPGTVVLVQPNPAVLYYPYTNYHGYRPHRRGHRSGYGYGYDNRHRKSHHDRHRVIGPYRPLGTSTRQPGYATPLPSHRYSSRSRY